jgi:Na+/H+-dicarboxylate symporter
MEKKKMSLVSKIMIGLVLGVAVGILFLSNPSIPDNYIKPFGTLFLNLVKMTIVPLVFASLVVGAASIGDVKKLGRVGGKTMIYFFVTTAFAVFIGLFVSNVLKPGIGITLSLSEPVVQEAAEAPSLVDTIINIVPTNPFDALVNGNMLQIIFFAILTGIGATFIGEKGQAYLNFCYSLAEIMYKLTEKIMNLAPYGVFALMTPVVANNGPHVLLPLIRLIFVCYSAYLLHVLITYSTTIKIWSRFSILQFFKGGAPAFAMAFSTSSGAATLPLGMKIAQEDFGVSESISSFVLPLGTTVNMDGTAIFQGACAVFIAQVYGIDLTLSQQLTIILTATLASVGTAGVPGAGFIMLTMVLSSVGLPVEGMALIAGIERILDMGRTTVNVAGNLSASIVVAGTEGEIDYDNAAVLIGNKKASKAANL